MKQQLKTEMIDIDLLIPDPDNANTHDEKNLRAITGSLKKFGQVEPLVVRKQNNIVIGGNGRLMAMRKLGWTECAVHFVDVDDQIAKALALALNRTSELSEWDTDRLVKQLKELKAADFEIGDIGFDADDFNFDVVENTEGLTDPDEVPEQVETRCKPGDLWILGSHRLLCGDSTNVQHVERLMGGEKADMTFTSPPYNAGCFGFDGGKSKYKKKGDDDLDQQSYFDFLCSFTNIALEQSTYVFFNNQFLSGNRNALAKFFGHYADMVKDVFPWIKNTAPPNVNKGVFTNRFEFFLCLEKGNAKKGFPVQWQGKYHNIIEGSTAAADNVAKGDHSATMPVYVPEWFLDRLDCIRSVYEPFCGTGTTLIACEKTGRKCYGMEIDPHYCSVIIERWEKFTGKKAHLSEQT